MRKRKAAASLVEGRNHAPPRTACPTHTSPSSSKENIRITTKTAEALESVHPKVISLSLSVSECFSICLSAYLCVCVPVCLYPLSICVYLCLSLSLQPGLSLSHFIP